MLGPKARSVLVNDMRLPDRMTYLKGIKVRRIQYNSVVGAKSMELFKSRVSEKEVHNFLDSLGYAYHKKVGRKKARGPKRLTPKRGGRGRPTAEEAAKHRALELHRNYRQREREKEKLNESRETTERH